MTLDRNKTELTHMVTGAAHCYLSARGCKPLEREVPIADKWVSDLAGVLCPTQTELIALHFLPSKPHWQASVERHHAWNEKYEATAHLRDRLVCLVEVKTSMSDYMREWSQRGKWRRKIPAHLAYIAIPAGMVHVTQVPNEWGLLEYSLSGDIRCSRVPPHRPLQLKLQCDALHAIGVRCDHRVRYAAITEDRKRELIHHNGNKSLMRFRDAMRAMRDIVEGSATVEQVLSMHRINLPECDIEKLRRLAGIKPPSTV